MFITNIIPHSVSICKILILNICLLLMTIIIFDDVSVSANTIGQHSHPHKLNAKQPCPVCLDNRLIQHYRERKCRPIIPGGCKCPSRFNCNDYLDENNDGILKSALASAPKRPIPRNTTEFQGRSIDGSIMEEEYDQCEYNGTRFHIGQIVPTADPCRICVCSFMSDGSLNVDCETRIECSTQISRATMDSYNGYIPMGSSFLIEQGRRRRRGPQPFPVNLDQQNSMISLHCYDYYTHDQCCPRQECMPVNSRTGRTMRPRKTCRYAGREYNLGEKIKLESIFQVKSNEDNNESNAVEDSSTLVNLIDQLDRTSSTLSETLACFICLCTNQWNNTAIEENVSNLAEILNADQISCRRKSCQLNFDPRFRRGCIPVYDEDKCCPVDFICPRTRQMAIRVRGVDYGSKMCHFEGRKYPIGSRIYQHKHSAAKCVDCECRIPPEFTCLKRKHCHN